MCPGCTNRPSFTSEHGDSGIDVQCLHALDGNRASTRLCRPNSVRLVQREHICVGSQTIAARDARRDLDRDLADDRRQS